MMRRLLPAPLLSCLLAAAWLALSRNVDAGQVLLALVFALFIPPGLKHFNTSGDLYAP